MSELVKFSCLSNPMYLCSDHFPSQLCQTRGINKGHTVWLDGARPPPKYVFKNDMSSINLNTLQLRPYDNLKRLLNVDVKLTLF